MNLEDAIRQACDTVGIIPPKVTKFGKWVQTDTRSGKNGKGDGRIIVNDDNVTSFNWQTGEKATVWLKDAKTSIERKEISRKIEQSDCEKEQAARRASQIANKLISGASLTTHSYLKRKGFPDERVLVVKAEMVAEIGGKYLVPDGARKAIVVPARIGQMGDNTEPEVVIHTDFAVELESGKELDSLLKAEQQGVYSKQTVRDEFKRRSVVSNDVTDDEEQERIAKEQEGLTPEENIDPVTGQPIEPQQAA